jgi:parallel beta-helix repeat protein
MYQLKLKHLLLIPFFLIFSISEIYADHISVYGDDSTGRVPDTGQTKCYDNDNEIPCPNPGEDFYGQDANYNINPQSFSKLDAQANELPYSATEWTMVRDNISGLIWEVKTDDGSIHDKDNKYTWYDSNPETNGGYTGTNGNGTDTEDFIKSLNESNYGGFSDWRLPSLKELVSIVYYGKRNPATNESYFPKIMSAFYWSSTSYANDTGLAWGVYFSNGYGNRSAKDSSYFVRAVRGGQCRSFDHSVNLVINTDETVTDTFTGLMWQKESTETRMTWQNAIEYCENMSLSDYNDWRLPTMHELRSIVNYLKYNPAMDQDFFSGILSAFYWSSTSNANDTGRAWGVNFFNGSDRYYAKDSSYFVRAVRGGQNRLFGHFVIGSPEQASKWQSGDKMPIKWDTQNIQGNVNISISREGGKTDTFIPIASNTPNDGEFEWTVTQQASVNCMLKIEPVNEPDKGTSQGLFSITATQQQTPVLSYAAVPSIVNGDFHSLALTEEGSVWAWGRNDYGQLGNSSTSNENIPVQVKDLNDITAIAAGRFHSMGLKQDGTVWAWGGNNSGQLGDSSTSEQRIPVQVKNLNDVTAIAAGRSHSLALKKDGTVWAWGYNAYGQLGDSSTSSKSMPVQVKDLNHVIAIAAGRYHSLALNQDGSVWTWGSNEYGQLGNSSTSNKSIPVQVKDLNHVIAIVSGEYHSLALKQDGSVWAWGFNSNGQLGDSSTSNKSIPVQVKDLTNDVIDIAVGVAHSLALKQDGSVWAWGSNEYGQRGDSNTPDKSTPVQVKDLINVIDISAGGDHSLALKHDGYVWAWGSNEYGQLGDSSTPNKSTPVQVRDLNYVINIAAGTFHSLALKRNGTVWAWGYNEYGQVGDSSTSDKMVPVHVKDLNIPVHELNIINAIAAGGWHSLALKLDSTVWAWGRNNYGQLGDSSTSNKTIPEQVKDLKSVAAIAAGSQHSLALRYDGTVWAWGNNGSGQLGNSSNSNTNIPVQVKDLNDVADIAAGTYFSLALKQDGTVWAWGRNNYGQLGDSSTTNRSLPVQVKDLNDVTDIAAGGPHSLALKQDGTVWAWGFNMLGQLGDSSTSNKNIPVQVNDLNDVTKIAAGKYNSLALKQDGSVWAWGDNYGNTPGQINNLSNVNNFVAGWEHTLILKEDGTVWGMGSNSSGQLGIGFSITQTKGPDGQGNLKLFHPPLTVCSSNCDYTSIQLAIESASLTDKVLVSDGTYVENINFKGKNISIQSVNGPEKTIIQGNTSNSIITFNTSEQHSAILKGFTIKSGISANGGGIYISGASPVISECIISNNNADNKGGGVYCENASPKFINCIFHNNTAENGHALYLYRSSPEIINCTISKNGYPIGEGIVIYDVVSSPVIINSILWNNGDEIILQNNATVTVEYSDIEGGYPGTGNIQSDPLFIGADQNNFHLLPASPCLNAATNVNAATIDIDYQERPMNDHIDIGADEAFKNTKPVANLSTNIIDGIEPLEIMFENLSTSQEGIIINIWNFGDSITSTTLNPTYSYTQQGIFTVSLTVYEEDGDTDTKSLTISVQDSNPTAKFSTNQTTGLEPLEIQFTNQSISYDGIETTWNFGNGITSTVQNPTHSYTQEGIFIVTLTAYEADGDTDTTSLTITVLDTDPIANFSANQTTGFAPLNVQFTNSSTSYDGFESHWNFGDGTTSTELNPLHAFSSGDYTVTLTVTEPDGDTSTKMISNMIQVYAIREICASGCEYTSIQMAVNDSRSGDRISVKPGTYSDTLDFQGKAIRIESTNGSNVTTIDAGNNDAVVRFAHQETNASILKGFTLKNGLSDFGGGIFMDNAAPVIENCRIIHNQAGSGGGLYLTNGASPKLSNCAVNDNIASNGAGVFIDHSNILFSQTTINFNIAAQNGGGMYLVHSSPDMDRIIIQGNHAVRGAGIYMTQNSLPQITRSQLSENSASESGGGACVMQQSGLNIVNSLIFGNSANFDGGGFYVKEAELQIHSSSLVHQYASFGRSVFADASSLTISNSILWNNGEEIEEYDSHVTVDHSDIQMADGIFPGEGNINEVPDFRDPLSDFRLNSSSPCIDAGTSTHAPTTDLSGKIRPSGDAPDMGAYEWNNREPSASFYARNTTVYSGITVEFRDRSYSYDGIQSWQWDFGDGTEDNSQHPIHTYETPGIYTVKLTIHESDGDTDTFTRYGYITIKGEEPTADFYANPRTGFGSLEAQFTDRSVSPQSEIVKWLWEFGDGQTSTERNPIHHYTTHGTYTVKLAVTNAAGAEHSISRYHYIQIQDTQPKASFSAYPLYGQKALTVRFYNRSSSFYDITNWHWDFGDGETSAESNPTHSYTHSGYYSVTLEVISAGGTSETFRNNYIHVFESVETFYVNVSGGQDQYTSIQSAIDVSNMGDTIIVAPGTYYETIDYKGKGITIKSSQGAEKTIIDANNIDAAVKCINGEDSGAVLRGFSVTNGFAMNGGGIYISGASSPTIIDCIVFNNQAQKEGGGIAAAYSSMPMIIDCEIKQNTARNGAGIACLNSSSASFRNTSIIENQALKNGGGVYVYYGSLPDIQSCDISNNMAQSRGGGVYGFGAAPKLVASHVNHNTAENGGGIMLHDALFPLIEETMIRENTATTGGALYLLDTSSPEIQNSLIADNQATYGGGLYVREVSTALINYSTFANNRAYSEGAGIYGSDVTEFTFRNGILWQDGNEIVLGESDVPIVEFSNVRQLEGIFSGVGNINQDPIFAGPKDYHLGLGSPCKNMGNAIHAPARDIAGVKRPVGSGFDIGAYEELNVPPVTNGKSVTTNEDRSITFQLIAEDDDDDPLTYVIVDQPENGIITGEGANITYKPKANYSGSDHFKFKTNDSYYDSNISTVSITIIAIADAPVLNLSPTTQGNEDTEIPIPVNTVLSDTDGSEVSSPVIIWDVPELATLSQGIKNPDGSYTLTTDQLSGLSLLPALHASDDITLTVQVTATETANSDSATITKLIHVDIIPVADKPELVVTPNAAGNEDTAIPLIISPPSLVDQDQSEILSDITLFNIPDHVVLSTGTQNADGTWTLTSTQLTSLNLTPGQHIADDFTLTVSVTATETENSDSATTTQTISVDIIPVADIPSWVVSPETFGNEDTAIPLTIAKPSLVDQDQSEILSLITVSQIPDHAVLSAGTKNPDGTWTLTSEQLSSLSLTPGKHIADDFTFEVHVTATETENSDAATATRSISVDIIPVADKPSLVVTPITSGNEDTEIPLTIELPSLVDKDQSEILSNITLFQIPDHAVLSAGIKNDDNTWTLSPDQLTSLTLAPGEHIADDFILTASITATETENSDSATTTQTISVDIIPVADKPTLVVTPDASGNEDTDIQLTIEQPSLKDQDQSEVLSDITLSEIPDHVMLSAGIKNDGGTWTLTTEQLDSLTLTPGKNIADDFTFKVSITATETENSDSETTTQIISVNVIPVADKPNLVVTPNASGNEDTPVQLTIAPPTLVDQDQSEVLSDITVSQIPDHAVLSAGTKNADGSWTLTTEQLTSLTITPGLNETTDFVLIAGVTSTETENSDAAVTTKTIAVDIIPVNDLPTISNINDQTTKENTPTSPIQFTIGDVETEAEKLILDINSSNNELISQSRIVLKGTGMERSVILLPEPHKYGLSTINISVKDELNGSSETSFVLTVQNVVRPGDFNDDGLIELMDSQIALNILAGYDEGIFYIEADVNGNKKVDLIDVIFIQQYLNNLPGIHDPNNDKNIDLKDVIILLQYLTDISNKSIYPEVYHDVFLSIDQVIYILNQVK